MKVEKLIQTDKNQSFGAKGINASNKVKENTADSFIRSTKKAYEKRAHKPGIKGFWSLSAVTAGMTTFLCYDIYSSRKYHRLKKTNIKSAIEKFKKQDKKDFLCAALLGYAVIKALQFIFSLNSDKKLQKLKDDFDKINSEINTNTKLDSQPINSSYIIGGYNFGNGDIGFSYATACDPYLQSKQKGVIRHELTHAQQSELIARSENGIKKMNYATAHIVANNIKKKPLARLVYDETYKDIQEDKTGKYDNVEIYLGSQKTNFKNYITAIHTLMTNPDASIDEIPMFINEQHYREVAQKKGKLSPEEEQKAQQYFEAAKNYTIPGGLGIYNPWNPYYSNLLEKEAFEQGGQNIIYKLSKLVNKK